jgi:hypothetical protein
MSGEYKREEKLVYETFFLLAELRDKVFDLYTALSKVVETLDEYLNELEEVIEK